MNPIVASLEISTELLYVVLLLLVSLANWIRNRMLKRKRKVEVVEEGPMREIIWRRQVGEAPDDRPFGEDPPGIPGRAIQEAPPPPIPAASVSTPVTSPPVKTAKSVAVSQKQAALAEAFENTVVQKPRRRTSHRAQIDRLLRSPSATKNAILLTEIIGSPLALKSQADH